MLLYIYYTPQMILGGNRLTDKQIDGLVQDCSNSSALAVELLQSYSKPSK